MRPARLERATFWFVAKRSIQLSYGRIRRGGIVPSGPGAVNRGAMRLNQNTQQWDRFSFSAPIYTTDRLTACEIKRDNVGARVSAPNRLNQAPGAGKTRPYSGLRGRV